MLDLHVHVLPGIDDGPRTLEDALALARALAEDGIEHIVATPHIYPGVFDNTANRIGEVFDEFQSAVSEAGIDLTMTWAAEVRICPEILEWIEVRRLPMLNGSLVGPSTALIELPDGQIPVGTDKLMGLMLDRGITPLMAHPERNKAVMEQHARLEALRRLGCKFQLTAGSLLGDFGTRAQTTAQKLLEAGWVDVIATDAHNRSSRRPRMKAAREWLVQQYDEALALRLTSTNPTEIAGVSSFSVQSGDQRLVFRDLPAMAPLDVDAQWSVDLMLGPDLSQPTVGTSSAGLDLDAPHHTAPGTTDERWSLIDFRIDALVDDLQSVSLKQDLPPTPSMVTGQVRDMAAAPAPSPTPDTDEDWQLPTFGAAPPAPPPVTRHEPTPKPMSVAAAVEKPVAAPAAVRPVEAPVPVKPAVVAAPVAVPVTAAVTAPAPAVAPMRAPAVEAVPLLQPTVSLASAAPAQRIEPIWESFAAPKSAVVDLPVTSAKPAPAAAPVPVPAPAMATPPLQPPQGMRLSEVKSREPEVPNHAEASRKANGTPLRPGPMAQAGHQAANPVDLSRSMASIARASHKDQPDRTAPPNPDGTRRGFRLSDLNPLPIRRR